MTNAIRHTALVAAFLGLRLTVGLVPALPQPDAEPGTDVRQVALFHQWRVGDVASAHIIIEGRGKAQDQDGTRNISLTANIQTREEVVRAGTHGSVLLDIAWEQAVLNVDGHEARLAPRSGHLEREVSRFGEIISTEAWGRTQAEDERDLPVAVDAQYLELIDLLSEQVEYLVFPDHPVAAGETWESGHVAGFGQDQATLTKASKVTAVDPPDAPGACVIETTIAAPVRFDAPTEGVTFSGRIGSTVTRRFDYIEGRLADASGLFDFQLRAYPLGEAPEEPLTPATAGAGLRLSMQLIVQVTRTYPPAGAEPVAPGHREGI